MKTAALLAIGGLAAACAAAPPQEGVPHTAKGGLDAERGLPIPADLAPHVQESIEIGRDLYLLDKASAIGTDMLRANVPDSRLGALGGWLTLRSSDEQGKPLDAFAVLFVTKDEPQRIVFRIEVPLKGTPSLKAVDPPKDLDDLGIRMFRARQTALDAVPHGRRPFNPVILPGSAMGRPDAIAVYLLSAELIPAEMVFGIHYRVLVSGDGTAVKQVVPLSRSALVIPPAEKNIPAGATPVAAFVSQIVTDWPLETHVFVSLLHGRAPVYVGTARGIWLVVGDKISLVDDKPPRATPP